MTARAVEGPGTVSPAAVPEHGVPPTILVIEDEARIRDVVRDAALELGYCSLEAASGAQGLAVASAERPDLIVLDLGLPDMDGIEVCRGLRRGSAVPIVVLSARHGEDEKAALLDAGADDYVTKPFGPIEFKARLKAQLRRSGATTRPQERVLTFGDLCVDLDHRRVMRRGTAVHLTPTEWALLAVLATNAGRTLTHRQLFTAVWGNSFGDAQRYLRVYLTHLRRKIESEPNLPRHIVTDPGVGYRFEP